MYWVRQNRAEDVVPFLMVDDQTHIAGLAGLSPVVELARPGSAWQPAGGVVSEMGHGWYALSLSEAERSQPGYWLMHAEAPGADPVDQIVVVLAYDPFDGVDLGLENLEAIRAGGVLLDEFDKESIADRLLAREIEAGCTLLKAIRAMLAVLAGVSSGGGTNRYSFFSPAGTEKRVEGTVDAHGNRSQVVIR